MNLFRLTAIGIAAFCILSGCGGGNSGNDAGGSISNGSTGGSTGGTTGGSTTGASTGGSTGGSTQPGSIAAAVIPVVANSVIADPVRQRIYVSVSGASGPHGNVIAAVDPLTGQTLASQFAGSEPNRLAITDDGHYLYVALDGESKIKRFVLPDLVPDISIPLGINADYGPNVALDLQAAPGLPETIAVTIGNHSVIPNSQQGLVIYDGATARPAVPKPVVDDYDSIQWGSTASTLYASDYESSGFSLYTFSVTSNGAQKTNEYRNQLGGFYNEMHYDRGNQLIYNDNGFVVNPATGTRVGSFTDGYGIVAPDSSTNTAYFADGAAANGEESIRLFDQQTYSLKRVIALNNGTGRPTHLIRWGASGLAFTSTGGGVLLTGSNGPTAPAYERVPSSAANVQSIALAAKDIVWDRVHGLIYASVPDPSNAGGDSIVAINPTTAQIVSAKPTGRGPYKLAISDDASLLYVGIDNDGAVERLTLPALADDIRVPLGSRQGLGPNMAIDIKALPGAAHSFVVSLGNRNYSPASSGMAMVYDDQNPRSSVATSFAADYDVFQFGSDPSTLYVGDTESSLAGLYVLKIDARGATQTGVFPNAFSEFSGEIRFDAPTGLLYVDDGRAIIPSNGYSAGTFIGSGLMIPDGALNRVFFLGQTRSQQGSTSYSLVAYDNQKYVPVAVVILSGVTDPPRRLIRYGTQGLAVLTASRIYFVDSAFSGSGAAVFTTTSARPEPVQLPLRAR